MQFQHSLILSSLLLLTACHARKEENGSSQPPHEKELADKRPVDKGPRFRVSGTLLMQGTYCGGAAPSREMLEEARRPQPAVGYKLYVRSGATNDIRKPLSDSAVVDAQGNFEFNLAKGSYTLLLQGQQDSTVFQVWRGKESNISIQDEQCLRQWFAKGLQPLNVAGESSIPTITLNKSCFLPAGSSCIHYDGPYPP